MPNTIDPAALRALLGRATPGEWSVSPGLFNSCIASPSGFIVGSDGMASYGQDAHNATLIVAAVNNLRPLLDALAAAEARVAALEAERAKTGRECPVCGVEIEGIGDYTYRSVPPTAFIKCEACGADLIVVESTDERYWVRASDGRLTGALLPDRRPDAAH